MDKILFELEMFCEIADRKKSILIIPAIWLVCGMVVIMLYLRIIEFIYDNQDVPVIKPFADIALSHPLAVYVAIVCIFFYTTFDLMVFLYKKEKRRLYKIF